MFFIFVFFLFHFLLFLLLVLLLVLYFLLLHHHLFFFISILLIIFIADNPVIEKQAYRVVTLFNSKTKVGVDEYNSLLLILDLLNQDGGINGKELLLEFTNYDGNSKNLYNEALSAINKFGSDILCFIGGNSYI